MEERFMKRMKENRGYLRAVAGMIVIALFLGLLPSAVVKKAKAENYNAGKDEIRVYLSQDPFVTAGHTGKVSISSKKITVTGWSYVWGGEFKYGKDGWDGNRGKWKKKKQTYVLDENCEYGDVNSDYSDLGNKAITRAKFLDKLKKYKNKKGICVVIIKYQNKANTIAFCKTAKLTKKEKLGKTDWGSVYAKGDFEHDPENYGQIYMKNGKLIVKGNITLLAGTLAKNTRKYTISSKCEYIFEHSRTTAAKMKKILREFNTGKKYSQVAISFKNNKVDCIELSARV